MFKFHSPSQILPVILGNLLLLFSGDTVFSDLRLTLSQMAWSNSSEASALTQSDDSKGSEELNHNDRVSTVDGIVLCYCSGWIADDGVSG